MGIGMKKWSNVLLVLLPLTVILAGYSLPSSATTTKHFVMYQNNSSGGKVCTGQTNCFNSTSPGPDIVVNQGDSVSITVHNNDTFAHTFTITSSPYTSVDTGQMSPSQVVTLPTFTAGTSGTSFHYQCSNHPTTMLGTFKVNPVSGTPITPTSLIALLGTATAAVFLTMRKRR